MLEPFDFGSAWLCLTAIFWCGIIVFAIWISIAEERKQRKAQAAIDRRQNEHLANAIAARTRNG